MIAHSVRMLQDTFSLGAAQVKYQQYQLHNTVEPQWLEHPSDHENLLEIWVVRATEG